VADAPPQEAEAAERAAEVEAAQQQFEQLREQLLRRAVNKMRMRLVSELFYRWADAAYDAAHPPETQAADDGDGGASGEGKAASGQQAAAAEAVSGCLLACIGSPCLRQCVHGASIGSRGGGPEAQCRRRRGAGRRATASVRQRHGGGLSARSSSSSSVLVCHCSLTMAHGWALKS
jgi:hypothetical protein